MRLQAYLAETVRALGPLPDNVANLFLRLDVDVLRPAALLRHFDLENYLTPLVRHLGAHLFCFVGATKRVGGGSLLRIGVAEPQHIGSDDWAHFSCNISGATGTNDWKTELRAALAATQPAQLPPGPVAARIAWRCPARRNWVQLWKPTGDAMGPVLGEPDSRNPFNPFDDRIVSLELHRCSDETMGNTIDVGMWWQSHRPATASQ
jgi:hypothetical protein